MTRLAKQERDNNVKLSRDYLSAALASGKRLRLEVTHSSRSGMMRHVRAWMATDSGSVEDVTWYVAWAIGEAPRGDNMGRLVIRVGGCGFSATVHVADALWYVLGQPGENYTSIADTGW